MSTQNPQILDKSAPNIDKFDENMKSTALYVFPMKHYELFLDPAIRGGQGMPA